MISAYNERSSPLLITMSLLESVPLARSIMRGIATNTIGIAEKNRKLNHKFLYDR